MLISEKKICDFPGKVQCELTEAQLLSDDFQLPGPKTIYLTLDDGPNNMTGPILDILKKHDVKVSFFLNMIHVNKSLEKDADATGELMKRYVDEGHLVGDHSYDHMFHNKPPNVGSGLDSYNDVMVDADYFGEKNFAPLRDVLKEQGVDGRDLESVERDFFK